MDDTSPEGLEAMAEQMLGDGIFEEADAAHDKMLRGDPEWTTREWTSPSDLITAFAVGVIRSDIYYHGYQLPANFERVMNWIAFNVGKRFNREPMLELSLLEIRGMLNEWAHENPEFVAWNETDKLVAISTRYDNTPEERGFIDLMAISQNTMVYIRDERRIFKAFNDKFDKDWEEEHGEPPFQSSPAEDQSDVED